MNHADSTVASHHHILPLKVYLGIGAALLVLTIVTVQISFIDFGPMNIVFALVIATIKALLVAFFFMHLWYDNKLFFICFTTALICLTVFITLTMADTARRGDIDETYAHPINPRAEFYSKPEFEKAQLQGHGNALAGIDSAAAVDTMRVPTDTTKRSSDTVRTTNSPSPKTDH